MKKLLLLTAIIILQSPIINYQSSIVNAQYNTWEWAHDFGKTNDYTALERVNSVITDSKGNIYVGGGYSQDFNMQGHQLGNASGDWAVFLAKFNSSGQVLWVKGFGGDRAYNDDCSIVCVDENDNVYLAGGFASDTLDFGNGIQLLNTGNYDPYFAKFDSLGNALWAVSGRGIEYGFVKGMRVVNGSVYITGEFEGAVMQFSTTILKNNSNNSASLEPYIAKFDTSGVLVWAKSVSGGSQEWLFDLDVDTDENIVIAGKYSGTGSVLDFGNNVMLVHEDEYQSLFIAKYDKDGNALWARTAIGPSGQAHESVEDIVIDHCGNIYASGDFTGSILKFDNIVLDNPNAGSSGLDNTFEYWAKFDKDGNTLWAKRSPKPTAGHAGGIAIGKSNNLIVYGGLRTDSTQFEMGDSSYFLPYLYLHPFVASLNGSTGEFDWSCLATHINDDDFWYAVVSDAIIDNEGNIATVGNYMGYNTGMETSYFMLGDDSIYTHGNSDIFIGRIPITQTVWSNKNDILSFSLAGLEDTVIVDSVNHTVAVTVPLGTGVTDRTPAITLSHNAVVCENHKDFSKPVTYTVYAEDGTTEQWTVTITGWDTSIDEKNAANNITVYPNPSNGVFIVKMSDVRCQMYDVKCQITDITGRVVYSKGEKSFAHDIALTINLSNHPKGIYFLKISTKNNICTNKININ